MADKAREEWEPSKVYAVFLFACQKAVFIYGFPVYFSEAANGIIVVNYHPIFFANTVG